MISANGGLPAHRYTPQVTQRWPQGSEPASHRALFRFLLCCVVSWYAVSSRGPVCRVVLVVSGFPALPPLPPLLPLLLRPLLPSGPASCCDLGCGAVLSYCAACLAVCCCLRRFLLCGAPLSCLPYLVLCVVALLFLVVSCWARLPAVVFCWCVLSLVSLPGRVACCPVLWCGFLVVPCSLVLCPVVLCFCMLLCCGAVLSVLLCWWCLYGLCPVLGRGAALPCCAA